MQRWYRGVQVIVEMASGLRSLCRLAAVVSLRRSVSAVSPHWRYLATASIPASKILTHQLRPALVPVPGVRGYAGGITSQELTERVLMVLKSFDKIDPTKVVFYRWERLKQKLIKKFFVLCVVFEFRWRWMHTLSMTMGWTVWMSLKLSWHLRMSLVRHVSTSHMYLIGQSALPN